MIDGMVETNERGIVVDECAFAGMLLGESGESLKFEATTDVHAETDPKKTRAQLTDSDQ